MKKKIIALFALALANSLYASWPMESVDKYNIVLVHGAADKWQGLDCENGNPRDDGKDYVEAYRSKDGVVTDPSTCHRDSVEVPVPNAINPDSTRDSVYTECDTTYYNPKRIGGIKMPNDSLGSSATGMVKELFPFLNEELFESPYAAYLQRPFVLPAGSPANNADEIGKSNWMGSGMCSARRSLIEEAKEFKAAGAWPLDSLRNVKPFDQYRTIASRNILVGHSMGGVAIREYVQGPNYNKDVDKIVTLDSPHEGTGSLNLLLALKDRVKSGKAVAGEALWPAGIAMVVEPSTASLGLVALVSAYLFDAVQVAVDSAIVAILKDKGGFDYYFDDPLADYIDPNKPGGVNDLISRVTPNMPMMRILGGEHSMVFTDPEKYTISGPLKGLIPDELALPLLNAWTFIGKSDDKSTDYVNAVAGAIVGLVGGVAVMDRGTALVPEWSSYGNKTNAFKAADADIKKTRYEAAVHARGYNPPTSVSTYEAIGISFAAATAALLVPVPILQEVLIVTSAVAAAPDLAGLMLPIVLEAVSDLQESHKIPAEGDFHREHFGEDRSYSIINGGSATARSYLMEDFLYERPFVNLALSLSDPALRAVEPGCYYEVDNAGKRRLCEVGLYSSRDSIVIDSVEFKDTTVAGKDSVRYDTVHVYNAKNADGDSTFYESIVRLDYKEFRDVPLKFKSESDWSRVGLKLDRWERVDGIKPGGGNNSKGVPIRHVERYVVPEIVVDSFIEKYSFVIDDLMPHRLRQIRLNFNYQEEIAWECGATNPMHPGTIVIDSSTSSIPVGSCLVLKRSGGSNWDTLKIEKHPVQKNGQFDFEPRKYGYKILSALQKDNQNTVTISTVNKIGLSNTQRLYYLFKATANKLDPVWPQRDVVLNKIKGFGSYASALGYQGFRVEGGKDTLFRTDGTSSFPGLDMDMTIDSVYDASRIGQPGVSPAGFVYDSSSAYFASRQHDSDPAEGNYLWKFVANIRNTAAVSAGADSNTYEVPFRVDRTAPDFTLEPERSVMNPDSMPFMVRYAWTGDSVKGPDIFAMRLTLEKFSNASSSGSPVFTKVAELRPYADVISPEFAIQWDAASRNTVRSRGDGLYRVRAYAVDYAVPDTTTYLKMLSLYDAIIQGGTVSDNMWPVASDSMNTTTRFAEFYIDRSAPVISNVSVASDSGATSIYSTLTRPQRNSQYAYVTGDSLAKITYRVAESLNGRDSVPVTVAWNFVHVGDTTAMDRAGDSVWVKSSGTASATWRESATMRLMDGDYAIRALARDAAGNTARYTHSKTLRVDRTPPHIVSLVSTRLVYPDSAGPFSATIAVDEKYDAPTNRTGMRCYYNVSGCGRKAPSLWKPVSNNVLHGDSLTFSLDSVVGTHGKCYLNAVCVDAAGNASARTDLFYIGERTPVITSPKLQVATPLVAITGVAPPRGGNDSLHTVYRIRYAKVDTTGSGAPLVWETEHAQVVSAIRNDTLPHVSKISQSEDGVLGYIKRSLDSNTYLEGTYVIELGTCAGPACLGGADSLWLTDTMTVFFEAVQDSFFGDTLDWKLVLDRKSVHVGRDSLGVSLTLSGKFNSSYFLRIYGEDSDGRGMFDESVSKVWKNPYYGEPADTTSDSSAVWFYELDDGYHLQWKGLAAGDSLRVSFDSTAFGNVCAAPDTLLSRDKCERRTVGYDLGSLYSVVQSYLADFPEWTPPPVVNGEMLLTGDSGHVVMKSTAAFRISRVGTLGDTAKPKMRTYFGDNVRDGFYWVENGRFGSDTLNPLVMGWTVNPRTYGLKFKWPGFSESGAYPAAGKMKVYMEITENVANNPHMHIHSEEVEIKLDSVKVTLPGSLPDYVLLKNDETLVCKSPTDSTSCEKRVMWLNAMVAKYGIKNRDARVKITISDGSGPIALLQDDSSAIVRANASDSAYQVRWDGKNNLSTAELKAGTYTLTIVATAVDGSGADTALVTFKAKFAETMYDLTPADPTDESYSGPAIHISEAKYDSNVNTYRYEPIADYLVNAEVSGFELPNDTLKNGIPLLGRITGMQDIFGYEPKRFSLAIKRHRKELKLVIVRKLHSYAQEITGQPPLESCENQTPELKEEFFIDTLTFSDNKKTDFLEIHQDYRARGYAMGGYYDSNYIDIIAFSISKWAEFLKDNNLSTINNSQAFENAKQKAEWALNKVLSRERYYIPEPSSGKLSDTLTSNGVSGCVPVIDTNGFMEKTCEYSISKKSDSYDPNVNLFDVIMSAANDTAFYARWYSPNTHSWCEDHKRYAFIYFNIFFNIPDSYWNSDFGMDNLVNRTVRFDHANISLFGDEGYWRALDSLTLKGLGNFKGLGNYHDGSGWRFDKDYGLLTPFETQYLPYYSSNRMQGGLNTFLFPDEDSLHSQVARFDLRFYGPNIPGESFVTKVLGYPNAGEDTSACSYDSTNISVVAGDYPYCQIEFHATDSVKHTPYFAANSNAAFYVGLNKRLGSVKHRINVGFPLNANWMSTVADSVCSDTSNWKFVIDGSKPCYKYYGYGSRVHYYYGDFTDDVWGANTLRSQDSTIKNLTNDPYFVFGNSQDVLKNRLFSMGTVGYTGLSLNVVPNPNHYDPATHRFAISLDTVKAISGSHTTGLYAHVDSMLILSGDKSLSLSATYDTLYIQTSAKDTSVIYRMSDDKLAKQLVRPNPIELSSTQLYAGGSAWMKDVSIISAQIMHLDSSEHSHLKIEGNFPSLNNFKIGFKDSIGVKRPKELVEMRAYLRENEDYRLAYLNGNAFYTVPKSMLEERWKDSIKVDTGGWYRLGWFDVNKLQGNTQFLLMWGDSVGGIPHNFSMFEMVVGRSVDATGGNTVTSLFEEVSVTFPANSLDKRDDFTVRTVDAEDYPFEVFNNLALKGPIVEVLPSMTFTNDSVLPRIQMKISYEEMVAMRATPSTIKLYKVDTTSKKFIPLENALYGYLNADGSPLVPNAADTVAMCSTATDLRCCPDSTLQWAYLLISAETHTFSVFTAMDSATAETPDFSLTVLPEVASSANRHVRVDGITRFRLYIDDDSLWADQGDATPPVVLAFTADSNGFAQVTLPSRNKDIDTSFVFVVALSEPDTDGTVVELPAAPAVARALTVNTQFSCTVPADSLWLGLDNGYLAYGAACTHPGYGTVSLYRDGIVAAEIRGDIPDTVIYDGHKAVGMGKIAPGVYESRYLGVSALGLDMQLAGPDVHTDSARPVIVEWSVIDSSDVLDRLFVVNARLMDTESGVARVVVTPVFGGDTLRIVTAVPDSAGNVEIPVRLTRKRLTECAGCVLSIAFRAEDYGHNHVERMYTSPEKLYPYPAQVALWYPAREGVGNYAHEFLGTGHDLELSGMSNPWYSDVGLYFPRWDDSALGVDTVNAGTSDSYSFEARIKDGHVPGTAWRRILGFSGIGGLEISLEARNGSIRLVEGTHMWGSSKAQLRDKEWVHVVVTVDSSMVRFYIDGSPVDSVAAVPLEREFYGVFSAGKTDSASSFIGNVADIRMYTSAIPPEQVLALSLPVTDEGEEVSDLIVVAIKDMNAISGFKNEFSCSVAGNKYLASVSDAATVSLPVIVQDAAEYNVVLYARSATAGNVSAAVGESAMQTGVAAVSNVWHAVTLSGVTLNLAAGTHTLKLRVPKGVEIGGFALSTADIPASMIAWGTSTADKVAGVSYADSSRKVKSYLRYEGYPETSKLRTRIRLRNVSSSPVNGFSVRYYFRGEDASQARVDRYVPDDVSTFPSVHLESGRTGYVEWKFPNKQIPVNGTVFNGDGPHFGLYNSDFFPWNASDDPSFVDPASGLVPNVDGFYEDVGVIVLDNDYNLIGGACAEMEDPTSLVTGARALAAVERDNDQLSEVHIKVENTGNVPLGNIDVRYYFYVESNRTPALDVYYLSGCSSVTLQNLGNGRWQANAHYNGTLAPGQVWNDPVKFGLHLQNWDKAWNASDDPSHDGLGRNFVEAHGVCVYDSAGNLLYGNVPAWGNPAPGSSGSGSGGADSTYHPGNGSSPGNTSPIVRTGDGLLVMMDSYAYVSLKLVNAQGEPIRTLFRGNLQAGQNLVRVNWNGTDMNNTYLVFKVNGVVRSTNKLSLL